MLLPPPPPAPVAPALALEAGRADALRAAGRHEQAVVVYERLLKRHPRESGLYYGLAWSWLARDQFGMALVPLREATRLAPGHALGWRELGRVYYMMRRFALACDALGKAVAMTPTDAEAWRVLGLARAQAGQAGAATQAFERAARLDAADALSRRQLGALAMAGHRPEAAERALTAALALASDGPTEALLLKALWAQSKYGEAAQLWWSQRWRPASTPRPRP